MLANTPTKSTTNSWLFPPRTREVQFDEKWAFVGKKEKHCDPENPDDTHQGDNRHNGTDRNRNRRKVRKTYGFSKDWEVHEAMTYFTMYSYNFCWAVRTLRREVSEGHYEPRTPAMVAGLTDHVWTTKEWATYPAATRVTAG